MTVVSKALAKAGRFFEANGLEGCSKIATCVRDQVGRYAFRGVSATLVLVIVVRTVYRNYLNAILPNGL